MAKQGNSRLETLAGRVVLVTGAASGIGRATARAFVAAEARVVLADADAEGLRLAAAEMGGLHPTLALPTDVSVDADLEALVRACLDAHGRIDVLVNNAGMALGGRFQDQDPVRLRRLVEVNLYGVLRLTQLVLPVLLRQQSGHVVNVSSESEFLAVPGYAGYEATKAGVSVLTRTLRRELAGSGIDLTLFFPGPLRTPMTEAMLASGKGTARVPHNDPETVARALLRAVLDKRRMAFASQPTAMWIALWVERFFPRLLDAYWSRQTSDDYYSAAALSGVRLRKDS